MSSVNQDRLHDSAPNSLLDRRQWMHLLSTGCLGLSLSGTNTAVQSFANAGEELAKPPEPMKGRELNVRIGVETLRNPFWYAENGYKAEAEQFWDRKHWERILKGWSAEGYNY